MLMRIFPHGGSYGLGAKDWSAVGRADAKNGDGQGGAVGVGSCLRLGGGNWNVIRREANA